MYDAADLEQLFFVMHHLSASKSGDCVIFAEKNRLLGTHLFTHAAKDAADHVDIEFAWVFLNLTEAILGRNFARLDFNRAGWTNKFAELTGHAADAAGLVLYQSRGAAIILWQLGVPFLFWILHRDLGATEEHIFEMPQRY